VRRRRDEDEAAWAAFDAALRAGGRPEPPPGLRERCLPAELRRGGTPTRLRRVLAVDDEPSIRRLLEVDLTRAGYQVVTARDGLEALAMARAAPPDLIVLDVMMPGLNGFQVLDSLKEEPATGEIPVIMLTARDDDASLRHACRHGADVYMSKPFNPAELRSVIDRFSQILGTPENPPPLRRWIK
jgi:two-component system alkaline phosphatase synthesis response regulator PhoP